MNYRQLSSISDGKFELFIDTSNGDVFLEENGVLIKSTTVDDSDGIISALVQEFESDED